MRQIKFWRQIILQTLKLYFLISHYFVYRTTRKPCSQHRISIQSMSVEPHKKSCLTIPLKRMIDGFCTLMLVRSVINYAHSDRRSVSSLDFFSTLCPIYLPAGEVYKAIIQGHESCVFYLVVASFFLILSVKSNGERELRNLRDEELLPLALFA
jgi:hypothetical protein